MDLAVIHAIHDPAGWKKALTDEHHYPPGTTSVPLSTGMMEPVPCACGRRRTGPGCRRIWIESWATQSVNDLFPDHVNYLEAAAE